MRKGAVSAATASPLEQDRKKGRVAKTTYIRILRRDIKTDVQQVLAQSS